MRRPAPRPAAAAIMALADRLSPQTTLAAVQRVWDRAVGGFVAAHAMPTGERDGAVVVTCESAVWAQELDLMGPEVVDRLNAALGADLVRSLRCQAAPAKGWSSDR